MRVQAGTFRGQQRLGSVLSGDGIVGGVDAEAGHDSQVWEPGVGSGQSTRLAPGRD